MGIFGRMMGIFVAIWLLRQWRKKVLNVKGIDNLIVKSFVHLEQLFRIIRQLL